MYAHLDLGSRGCTNAEYKFCAYSSVSMVAEGATLPLEFSLTRVLLGLPPWQKLGIIMHSRDRLSGGRGYRKYRGTRYE